MKKITKKEIKEAPKYMLFFDFKASAPESMTQEMLTADNLIEAMDEAAGQWSEEVYLMKILEKTDELASGEDEGLGIIYTDKITSRQPHNWHPSNLKNSESTWRYAYNPQWSVFPITYLDVLHV